ncbi:HAMP domain-containing histidine kinase [bacterium]|nr:HAMP domain-containing histidine kinase [bacterium]
MDNLIQLQTSCVSHEIRNHVSICDMYTEIVKKQLERTGYENEAVTNALDCIKKSLKIIGTSLLDLKLINNLETKKCELKYIVEEGVRLASAYTLGKEIDMQCVIKNSAPILIDENKFLACIVNIIKNGIEAIETKGEIQIIALVKENNAHIKISNNGKMIPKEKQEKIFEQGFTTKSTGCGLGLHICKSHLQSQNAELRLNKSNKTQTEFEIVIPTTQS